MTEKELAATIKTIPYHNNWYDDICTTSDGISIRYTDDEPTVRSLISNPGLRLFGTIYDEQAALGVITLALDCNCAEIANWLLSNSEKTLLISYSDPDYYVGYIIHNGEKIHTSDAVLMLIKYDNRYGFIVAAVRPTIIGVGIASIKNSTKKTKWTNRRRI